MLPDPVEEARHHAGKGGGGSEGEGWPPGHGTGASRFQVPKTGTMWVFPFTGCGKAGTLKFT